MDERTSKRSSINANSSISLRKNIWLSKWYFVYKRYAEPINGHKPSKCAHLKKIYRNIMLFVVTNLVSINNKISPFRLCLWYLHHRVSCEKISVAMKWDEFLCILKPLVDSFLSQSISIFSKPPDFLSKKCTKHYFQ